MSKNHDALPVPDTQVFARPLGKLQYSCPNCGQAHPFKAIRWRRCDLQCIACHTKYQIGLGFSDSPTSDAFIMGKWDSYTANRLNPIGTHYDSAKLYGTVEFQCPDCLHPQKDFCAHDGKLQCESCNSSYFISVLFYRLPKVSRLKVKAPFDSIVKGLSHAATTPTEPTPAAPTGPRPGAPSRRPRKDS